MFGDTKSNTLVYSRGSEGFLDVLKWNDEDMVYTGVVLHFL